MNIANEIARKAAHKLCEDADVELVEPHDLRRSMVAHLIALVYLIAGKGSWSFADITERVTFTLPGVGSSLALTALRAVPSFGEFLATFAEKFIGKRAAIFPAPELWAAEDGGRLLGTIQHELGHVGDVTHGGLLWCVAYLLVDEVRGAAERCYGTNLAHAVKLSGQDLDAVAAAVRGRIAGYGLSDEGRRFLNELLDAHVASLRVGTDPTGTVQESLAALRAVGWEP